jgi:hypothetical protein
MSSRLLEVVGSSLVERCRVFESFLRTHRAAL